MAKVIDTPIFDFVRVFPEYFQVLFDLHESQISPLPDKSRSYRSSDKEQQHLNLLKIFWTFCRALIVFGLNQQIGLVKKKKKTIRYKYQNKQLFLLVANIWIEDVSWAKTERKQKNESDEET